MKTTRKRTGEQPVGGNNSVLWGWKTVGERLRGST